MLFYWEILIDGHHYAPPVMSSKQAQTATPDQTEILREAGLKHKLICALVVSPILNLMLRPRLEAGKRPHVCIYK